MLNRIIYREDVQPAMLLAELTSGVPDWRSIKEQISRKYNKYYAGRAIYDAKIMWFATQKKPGGIHKNITLLVSEYQSQMNNREINGNAWEVCSNSAKIKTN